MARVLVVDDDEGMRLTLERSLKAAGYEVTLAADGVQALELYRAAPSDVVVIDIFMPNTPGLETIVSFRKEFPRVRIVAMSGNPFQNTLLRAANRMETLTIAKPFEPEDLVALIERALAK